MRREPTAGIVLAGSAAFLNLYATQPLLPLLARTFRASTFDVGLTVTAPTIAVAISAPIIGRVADRAGLRRVIVGCAFLLAVATALAATAASLRQLIAWRFVQGLLTPGIFAGTIAYIHAVWPATKAGRATAAYMTGTIIGGFTGRALAGLVAADVNWQASFVALAILSLGVAGALFVWLPEEGTTRSAGLSGLRSPDDRARYGQVRRSAGGAKAAGPRSAALPPYDVVSGFGHLFQNGQLLATFGIGFCILFTQVAMFTYVTFHLAAPPFRLSTAALGWLFAVYLVGAAITPFGGHWIDRYGHRAGLGSAMGIGAAGALLTLMPSLPVIAAGLALCSTGVFIAQSSTSSYIGAVTTRDRALAVGLYSTCYYIGGSVGAALPAVLWNTGGWTACVALIVVIQTTGVAIAMTFWKTKPSAGEPYPETLPA